MGYQCFKAAGGEDVNGSGPWDPNPVLYKFVISEPLDSQTVDLNLDLIVSQAQNQLILGLLGQVIWVVLMNSSFVFSISLYFFWV